MTDHLIAALRARYPDMSEGKVKGIAAGLLTVPAIADALKRGCITEIADPIACGALGDA